MKPILKEMIAKTLERNDLTDQYREFMELWHDNVSGYSQADMARLSGLTPTSISRIARGEQDNPTLNTRQRILDAIVFNTKTKGKVIEMGKDHTEKLIEVLEQQIKDLKAENAWLRGLAQGGSDPMEESDEILKANGTTGNKDSQ